MSTTDFLRRRRHLVPVVLAAWLVAGFPTPTRGQAGRLSPHETRTFTVDGATITITYGRPLMRGRQIFGRLVSFDRVWMPGADEATLIKTDRQLKIGSLALAPGEYSLYTIPGSSAWTLIVNRQTGQFHTVYNQDRDLARIEMTVESLPQPVEQLTISAVAQTAGGGGQLRIEWETTRASVPFTVAKS